MKFLVNLFFPLLVRLGNKRECEKFTYGRTMHVHEAPSQRKKTGNGR